LIVLVVLFIVLCFIGLVVGLSLGLKTDDNCSGGLKHCDVNVEI